MTCDDILLMLIGVLATFVCTVVAILVIPGFAILMDRFIKLRGSLGELERVLIRLEDQFKEFITPDFKGFWLADEKKLRLIYEDLGRLKEGFPVIGSRLGGIPVVGAENTTHFDLIQFEIGNLITMKVYSGSCEEWSQLPEEEKLWLPSRLCRPPTDEEWREATGETWNAIKDHVTFLKGCVDNMENREQTKKFFFGEVVHCYKVLWKHLWLVSYGPRAGGAIRRLFKSL
jgi:hypothetical protein